MGNSGLEYSDATGLSDDTRREISEFVDRSDHYDSIEEFIEDATRYQVELLQRAANTSQRPIERTDSVVLRVLTLADRTVTTIHQRLLDVTRRYVSLVVQSEDRPTRSRTTAAKKMEQYGRSAGSDACPRTYRQRTVEMHDLLEQEDLSADELEQEIRNAENA